MPKMPDHVLRQNFGRHLLINVERGGGYRGGGVKGSHWLLPSGTEVYGFSRRLNPPPRVQRTIWSQINRVRTGVFVGHAVRCTRQNCETAVTRPEAQDTQPIQSWWAIEVL